MRVAGGFIIAMLIWAGSVLSGAEWLSVGSEPVALPSTSASMNLSSEKDYPLFLENDDECVVGVPVANGAVVFWRISKAGTNDEVIKVDNTFNRVRLKRRLSARAYSVRLEPNQEAQVVRKTADGAFAEMNLVGCDRSFTVWIPKTLKGIKWDTLTKQERFLQTQKAKNLRLWQGQWLPETQVQALEQREAVQRKSAENIVRECGQTAKAGFIVLRDGTVVAGKSGGTANGTLFFKRSGEDFTTAYSADRLSSDPAFEQIAYGYCREAEALIHYAENALKAQVFTMIEVLLGDAEKMLKRADPKTAGKYGYAALLQEVEKNRSTFKKALDTAGLVHYNGELVNRQELQKRLTAGQIQFHSVWIYPEQVCTECGGEGEIDCPSCFDGETVSPCPACSGGYLVCSRCRGFGEVNCARCAGHGKRLAVCLRCHGAGRYENIRVTPPRAVVVPHPFGVQTFHSGGFAQYVTDICSDCGGSGQIDDICTFCKGLGKVSCAVQTICPRCRGEGGLRAPGPSCDGKKIMGCPKCSGKGYTGKPLPPPV